MLVISQSTHVCLQNGVILWGWKDWWAQNSRLPHRAWWSRLQDALQALRSGLVKVLGEKGLSATWFSYDLPRFSEAYFVH